MSAATVPAAAVSFKRHRVPAEVISHAVWRYPRSLRRDRDVEALPRRLLPQTEHRRYKGLNNRAEHSHRPTRRRERVPQRFKSPAHAQQFLTPYVPISEHFRPRRHRLPAAEYHQLLQTRFATWREVTELRAAA